MISGIVLAAGDSSRMGTPKALLKLGGKTFLEIICDNIRQAGVGDIVVVLGKHADEIKKGWKHAGEKMAINPHPEKGQISSLQAGVKTISKDTEAVLMALVDQPFVELKTYKALIDCWRKNSESIVIPKYKGKRGHPIILPANALNLCLECPPDKGLHWVTHHESVKVKDFETDDANILKDIDTQDDYKSVTAH